MQTPELNASLDLESTKARTFEAQKRFNLLGWFSWVSLIVVGSVVVGLGVLSTRFVIEESVHRDALLTAQFIKTIASTEMRHVVLPPGLSMGELLDPRQDQARPDISPGSRNTARGEFLDHVEHLPDVLLANIYAPDRTIIWSTNPRLIGQRITNDEDLEEAFELKTHVCASYHSVDASRAEQKFPVAPELFFIENYIPLLDVGANKVMAMVEVYKEPRDLIIRMTRGLILVWVATLLGGALIYFSLYWLMRRAADLLTAQHKQLITNETFVALGEMSSAVAHSLRNPLASIRSSAELAQEIETGPAQKNITDIINQVDRMSKWVRELLQSLRPLNDEAKAVDLVASVRDSLQAFEQQIARARVQVNFAPGQVPLILSQEGLLSQMLNSLIGNALDAMSTGGVLTIEVEPAVDGRVRVTLTDTGKGMTRHHKRMAFKPFFTTRQGGLGVGLMLVKRVMEQFNGSVSLTSREQEGTRISLVFNVAGGEHGTQHTVG
ncbi:sensor histidine kinase [Pseudomonas fluorescens]|uniref:histidine kinase n=1 Tax=Pseudomonas fluorescens TaxID=294 RepID=A0A5E7FQI5_PSEFL|nr:HAMP domain-containing sensor histidine kinase [Pseudomonas fluorescens]VVO41480.1 Adaptive-response sensory-kinase SasA [Pseudomonas fluorescens]